jgi:hypothetical protein
MNALPDRRRYNVLRGTRGEGCAAAEDGVRRTDDRET